MFRTIQIAVLFLFIILLGRSTWAQPVSIEPRVGNPIENELTGGDKHEYTVNFAAGQYFELAVVQKGVNLIVTLFGPNGNKVIEVGAPTSNADGTKWLVNIADEAGDHKIAVTAYNPALAKGKFSIELKELRESTQDDRHFVFGQGAQVEAGLLLDSKEPGSKEKAFAKLEMAAESYRQIAELKRRVPEIHNLAGYYLGTDLEKAIHLYEEALELYKDLGSKNGVWKVLLDIGLTYEDNSEFQKAVDYYEQALEVALSLNNEEQVEIVYNELGRELVSKVVEAGR